MKKVVKYALLCLSIVMIMSGCTISIILTHATGTDNDVAASPTTEAKTDADISVPAIP